jgi:predicted  nucleic acid-binding Zn-ribbon protein
MDINTLVTEKTDRKEIINKRLLTLDTQIANLQAKIAVLEAKLQEAGGREITQLSRNITLLQGEKAKLTNEVKTVDEAVTLLTQIKEAKPIEPIKEG